MYDPICACSRPRPTQNLTILRAQRRRQRALNATRTTTTHENGKLKTPPQTLVNEYICMYVHVAVG